MYHKMDEKPTTLVVDESTAGTTKNNSTRPNASKEPLGFTAEVGFGTSISQRKNEVNGFVDDKFLSSPQAPETIK